MHPEKIYKSNDQKRSGDNENAILWTPLLTPFAEIDTFGPTGPGCLLYGERTDTGAQRCHFPVTL
jgi:hypothetical protein